MVYVGGEIPDITGLLLDDSIPEGPAQVMATPTDEILANSVLNSTVQVRVTSSPEVMGLSKLLVIVTIVGPGTACGHREMNFIQSDSLLNL